MGGTERSVPERRQDAAARLSAPDGEVAAAAARVVASAPVVQAEYVLRAAATVEFPALPAAAVRGAIGRVLAEVHCDRHDPRCAACDARASCPASLFFAHGSDEGRSVPAPWSLAVRVAPREVVPAGGAVVVRFAVFGAVGARWLPFLLGAAEAAFAGGIGAGRPSLAVESLRVGGKPVVGPYEADAVTAAPVPVEPWPPGTDVIARIVSPLRLSRREPTRPDLPFAALVSAIVRRAAQIAGAWAGTPVSPLDDNVLWRAAGRVRTVSQNLRSLDLRRYQAATDRLLPLGGIMGRVRYTGPDLQQFGPLLRLAEAVQVGKSTTLGLGCIEFEALRGRGTAAR